MPSIVYRGEKYYLKKDGRWKNRKGQNIHRIVYADNYGPIAKGLDIHHLDGDPSNNDLSNLRALTRSEHIRVHYVGERLEQQKEIARKMSLISKIVDVEIVCMECGVKKLVPRSARSRAKWCSQECRSNYEYKNKKRFRTVTCEICKVEFETKCRKTRTCSYACGWDRRRRGGKLFLLSGRGKAITA